MRVFYTDRFVGDNFAGTTYGPFIFIRPQYRADIGLLKHEQVHVAQFKRTFGLMSILYLFTKWRLRYEVEAYREQLKWYPDDQTAIFAAFIATKYRLNISIQQATNLLKEVP